MLSPVLPVEAVARLRAVKATLFSSKDERTKHEQERAAVLARFRALFNAEHLPELTADEFRSFLSFKDNKHWSNLERLGPRITKDMAGLRQALQVLLSVQDPARIASELDRALGLAFGMGKGVATALLLVMHDDIFGVWNSVTEDAMSEVGLLPAPTSGQTTGQQYAAINAVLLELKRELEVDLWTLDWIWWRYLQALEEQEDEAESSADTDSEARLPESAAALQRFRQERGLHDFLYANWDTTVLGASWQLTGRDDDDAPGYEFRCDDGVGRIDLLAKHRTEERWLVIEIKKTKSDEQALGQLLRYMGWVKERYAPAESSVEGMLISSAPGPLLEWALKAAPNVRFMKYRVSFDLEEGRHE
jgi:hypothetical protein